MSTAIDESIPISDEDFEAQLTSALASLEGTSSAAELTDEVIVKHLFKAGNGGSEPKPSTPAQTEFTAVKVIKVTKQGSSKPIANGSTDCTYNCLHEPRTDYGVDDLQSL